MSESNGRPNESEPCPKLTNGARHKFAFNGYSRMCVHCGEEIVRPR